MKKFMIFCGKIILALGVILAIYVLGNFIMIFRLYISNGTYPECMCFEDPSLFDLSIAFTLISGLVYGFRKMIKIFCKR